MEEKDEELTINNPHNHLHEGKKEVECRMLNFK